MPEDRQQLTVDQQKLFTVDSKQTLYWNGKKVRLSEWSIGDKVAVAAAIIGVIAILAGLIGNWPNVKEFWHDFFGTKAPSSAPGTAVAPKAVSPQQ